MSALETAVSTENLKRPKKEVNELFRLFHEWLERYLKKESGFFEKYNVRIRFIGDLDKLPKSLVRLMEKLMIRTAKYQKKVFRRPLIPGTRLEKTVVMNVSTGDLRLMPVLR